MIDKYGAEFRFCTSHVVLGKIQNRSLQVADDWHEECAECGEIIPIGWVTKHRMTHEAERRLMAELRRNVV